MGAYGMICYLRDHNLTLYSWIHITCVAELTRKEVREELTKHAYYWTNIHREGVGCSVCGRTTRKKDLLRLGRFLIHRDCVEELIQMTDDAMAKHGQQIAVTLI
jgi:hypothetical protein